jgi:hypothetical protein
MELENGVATIWTSVIELETLQVNSILFDLCWTWNLICNRIDVDMLWFLLKYSIWLSIVFVFFRFLHVDVSWE